MAPRRLLPFVLVAITAIAVYLCFLLARPFLPAITWALALAVLGNPLYHRIAARVPDRPNLAAILTVTTIVIVVVTPIAILANSVVDEISRATDYVDKINWQALPGIAWLGDRINLQQELQGVFTSIRERIGPVLRGTADMLLQTAMTLFFLFFFFRDQQLILDTIRRHLPLSQSESTLLLENAWHMILATVNGTLVVGAIQGFLGGLMFWFLGLPGPILWGFVMAVFSTIPLLGAFIVWIPAAIYLLTQNQWWKAAILSVWGAFIVGFIDNLLYPVLVGRDTRTHTLPVFVAIIGGIIVFGAPGIILGPLIFSLTLSLLEIWRNRMHRTSPASRLPAKTITRS